MPPFTAAGVALITAAIDWQERSAPGGDPTHAAAALERLAEKVRVYRAAEDSVMEMFPLDAAR